MAKIYRCSNCGGDMQFNPDKGLLVCGHCGNTETPEQYNEDNSREEDNKKDVEGVMQYKCPSCGAELVTDSYTAATKCTYCDSPIILEDRLSNQFKPDCLIPFKYNRNDTLKKIKEWCKNGLFTPNDFLSENNLQKLAGIYVPFWLYGFETNTRMSANCTKVKVYTVGDTEYTETYHYIVERDIDADFKRVPADASIKMDDELMDLIEPFNYQELVGFQMPYLSGYMAEKYNYTDSDLVERVRSRVDEYAYDLTKDTIDGYSTVTVLDSRVQSTPSAKEYAMLPVWMYNYNYKGKDYTFVMNGQTGKINGRPPVSVSRVILVFLTTLIAIFGLISVIMMYLGGL